MAGSAKTGHDVKLFVAVLDWAAVALFNLLLILINRNNVFTRWCCATNAFLGITNRAAFVSRSAAPRRYFCWDHLDGRHLVSGFVHPVVLFLYRLLAVAYFAFCCVWQGIGPKALRSGYPGGPGKWFTFFTNWGFIIFALYGFLGFIVSWRELSRRSSAKAQRHLLEELPTQQFGALDKAFLFALVTAGTCGITLTAFYWVLIYDSGFALDNVLRHGGSAAYVLLDIFVSRVPIVTYHFQVPVLFGTAYLVFMWVLWGLGDYWRYGSLDASKTSSISVYVQLCALLAISFAILYLVAGLRELVTTGKCCCMCRPQCGACCQEDESETKSTPPTLHNVAVQNPGGVASLHSPAYHTPVPPTAYRASQFMSR